MSRNNRSVRIVFRILAAYILFQFFWWAFHIIQLHGEIRDMQLALAQSQETAELIRSTYTKKVWMVIGEGLVFVGLLLFGLWRIGTYLRKEAELARKERNFMLAVTHELKTPIATLRLFLDTLRTRDLPKEKSQDILSNSLNETHRLDHLVENILLSTRLENDDDLVKQRVDLSALLEKVGYNLAQLDGDMHKVTLDIDEKVAAFCDGNKMESVFINLIENALKYSPEGAEVTVSLKTNPQEVVVAVQDQGAGIPEEERERIFSKFYRIGNEDTRRSKGTGLGLYLVDRIINQHNGRIHIADRDGGGTIFTVAIPKI
ncbi:sensor histidine kinase [Sanyastnella coralliicola]|uniref:sensor histidine kinase n=1 Tax=Sanyastnella coralliicola TaxID=3069118 RepID=UPI0027B9E90F|nr:ATP-binding protein [Longitalea sp. SCSIO 12813]